MTHQVTDTKGRLLFTAYESETDVPSQFRDKVGTPAWAPIPAGFSYTRNGQTVLLDGMFVIITNPMGPRPWEALKPPKKDEDIFPDFAAFVAINGAKPHDHRARQAWLDKLADWGGLGKRDGDVADEFRRWELGDVVFWVNVGAHASHGPAWIYVPVADRSIPQPETPQETHRAIARMQALSEIAGVTFSKRHPLIENFQP